MSTIRAHFDGKVFVPDEPVSLPPGAPVEVAVTAGPEVSNPLLELAQLASEGPADPNWPQDFSAEVDHYLYGAPKNSQP